MFTSIASMSVTCFFLLKSLDAVSIWPYLKFQIFWTCLDIPGSTLTDIKYLTLARFHKQLERFLFTCHSANFLYLFFHLRACTNPSIKWRILQQKLLKPFKMFFMILCNLQYTLVYGQNSTGDIIIGLSTARKFFLLVTAL